MKHAIDLPLDLGSPKMSAKMPAAMTIGAEAEMPHMRRKIRKDGKFGATAHAMVKTVKKKNVITVIHLLPICSEAGAKHIGPVRY